MQAVTHNTSQRRPHALAGIRSVGSAESTDRQRLRLLTAQLSARLLDRSGGTSPTEIVVWLAYASWNGLGPYLSGARLSA